MRILVLVLGMLVSGIVAIGCKDASTGPDPIRIEQDTDQHLIVDRTGKRWDVTFAKRKYGLVPEKFQFGLGPFAIQPILDAKMLSPGELGYPNDDDFVVLGTSLNGFTRAYPLYIMKFYEIADEKFGDAHVAVAY